MRKLWLLLLVPALFVAGCDNAPEEVALTPAACGFPSPSAKADADIVDPAFVLEGSVFIETSSGGGLIGAHMFVPVTVEGGFKSYQEILKAEGFKIVGRDNEGFEAEIYFRKERSLGAIQIRQSTCRDATSVFLNLPAAA